LNLRFFRRKFSSLYFMLSINLFTPGEFFGEW